jgi:hypothetical protein
LVGLFLSPFFLEQQQPAGYHDVLIALRDTLTSVQAALSEFRQDLPQIGKETVLARSSEIGRRCRAAEAQVSTATERLRPAAKEARHRTDAESLLRMMGELRTVLRRECQQGLRANGPGIWADTVRAWGPYRADRIDRSIRAYEAAAAKFAAAWGVELEPRLPNRVDSLFIPLSHNSTRRGQAFELTTGMPVTAPHLVNRK